MRILLASDLHYTLPQLDWVLAQLDSDDIDLVVLAGDQLDIASHVPLDAQVAMVQAVVERLEHPERLVVSSGNHDLTGPDEAGEQAAPWLEGLAAAGVATDGRSIRVGGALVTVCPWWVGPVGRERVRRQLADDAATGERPWIWVYHWPPDGSPTCWTGRQHYGDPDLSGWIDQFGPDIVLTGHVHDPPFKPGGAWADRIGATWVFNAGRQMGPVPAFIEIDLAGRRAEWFSLMGREEQSLDEPPVRGAGAVQ